VSHLVNANKKVVSKTPRTDRQSVWYCEGTTWVKIGFARQLERQLADTNKRIKELESAIKDISSWVSQDVVDHALELQNKAKEANQ